jgi:hypothetical protein
MTTPQSQLYYLAEKVRRLSDMFEEDENGRSTLKDIEEIRSEVLHIAANMERIENLLDVIIKLLGNKDK